MGLHKIVANICNILNNNLYIYCLNDGLYRSIAVSSNESVKTHNDIFKIKIIYYISVELIRYQPSYFISHHGSFRVVATRCDVLYRFCIDLSKYRVLVITSCFGRLNTDNHRTMQINLESVIEFLLSFFCTIDLALYSISIDQLVNLQI